MSTPASGTPEEGPASLMPSVKNVDYANSAIVPITTLMQPLVFARTLIQIGYEPLEPITGRSLFLRRPGYYYPNVLTYINHIRKTEGIQVLFTGLIPKLCNVFLANATDKLTDQLIRHHLPYQGEDAEARPDQRSMKATCYEIAVCSSSRTMALVASHPFHVIMVRMICSVVNNDEAYKGLFSTVKEIYNTEGIMGFFSGFTPRWIAELVTVTVGGAIMYGIYKTMNSLDVNEESVRTSSNYNAIVQFGLSSVVYKYQLTATVMSASCPGLHLGLPKYPGWRACLSDLTLSSQLSRGSAYFYRKAIL